MNLEAKVKKSKKGFEHSNIGCLRVSEIEELAKRGGYSIKFGSHVNSPVKIKGRCLSVGEVDREKGNITSYNNRRGRKFEAIVKEYLLERGYKICYE